MSGESTKKMPSQWKYNWNSETKQRAIAKKLWTDNDARWKPKRKDEFTICFGFSKHFEFIFIHIIHLGWVSLAIAYMAWSPYMSVCGGALLLLFFLLPIFWPLLLTPFPLCNARQQRMCVCRVWRVWHYSIRIFNLNINNWSFFHNSSYCMFSCQITSYSIRHQYRITASQTAWSACEFCNFLIFRTTFIFCSYAAVPPNGCPYLRWFIFCPSYLCRLMRAKLFFANPLCVFVCFSPSAHSISIVYWEWMLWALVALGYHWSQNIEKGRHRKPELYTLSASTLSCGFFSRFLDTAAIQVELVRYSSRMLKKGQHLCTTESN